MRPCGCPANRVAVPGAARPPLSDTEPVLIPAVVAFFAGYAIGALPVAWLLVRRRHGIDMRARGRAGPSATGALFVGGVRTAIAAGILECGKGAVVGLAARLYSGSGWFIAVAIAGCVVGDAFPVALRRRGRGLLPLVTALLVALPSAGVVTAVVALPAALLTSMRGRVFESVVAIAVPAGLLLGTRDWRSLAPAAIIVAGIVLRERLRRRRRTQELRRPAWQSLVVDADLPLRSVPSASGRQNPRTWEI
jgi:acyl phosphate:glycerol-3-phosphate acyltransferase